MSIRFGDVVTYNVKIKIRDNEYNRSSISEVNVNDVYPEEYLEYLPDTLVKKRRRHITYKRRRGT